MMLKTIGLCILIFTIYKVVSAKINALREGEYILDEIISLFKSTLSGVKNYMKPIGEEINTYSSPVLNKYGIKRAILDRDTEKIEDCHPLCEKSREVLIEYVRSYGGIDHSDEVARLTGLISALESIERDLRSDTEKGKKLYTTLGASISFALIILVI